MSEGLAPPIHVINLDRSADRLETFTACNAHLGPFTRFRAVDGSKLDRAALVAEGLVVPECNLSAGRLGSAFSHITLLKLVVAEDRAITIAEDDAIFAKHFGRASQALMNKLPPDWDLVMWGWNYDATLWAEIPEGVAPCRIQGNQGALRRNIERFADLDFEPTPLRLRHNFGLMAYTVRPPAARMILDTVLPLRNRKIEFADYGTSIDTHTYDSMANAAYEQLKAYVSVPPLVVSENRHETSTTWSKPISVPNAQA